MTYSGSTSQACWSEISYIYSAQQNYDQDKVYIDCQKAPTTDTKNACYLKSVSIIADPINNTSLTYLSHICDNFSYENSLFQHCMNNVISSMAMDINNNKRKMIFICENKKESYRNLCFASIIENLKVQSASSKTILDTCLSIPVNLKPEECKG